MVLPEVGPKQLEHLDQLAEEAAAVPRWQSRGPHCNRGVFFEGFNSDQLVECRINVMSFLKNSYSPSYLLPIHPNFWIQYMLLNIQIWQRLTANLEKVLPIRGKRKERN